MAQALQPLLQVDIGVGPDRVKVPAYERYVHEAICALTVPRPTGRLARTLSKRLAAELRDTLCTSSLPDLQAARSGLLTAESMPSLGRHFAPSQHLNLKGPSVTATLKQTSLVLQRLLSLPSRPRGGGDKKPSATGLLKAASRPAREWQPFLKDSEAEAHSLQLQWQLPLLPPPPTLAQMSRWQLCYAQMVIEALTPCCCHCKACCCALKHLAQKSPWQLGCAQILTGPLTLCCCHGMTCCWAPQLLAPQPA